ncbi:hypothetical protein QR98_0071800 [Sarcoptes scabiei]|uniref:Uncharacterized protein n=1 Tax=Sarcoptes scabiei TaxID=52283 RepID=A0A132ACM0_SARSC|nr:hypothetical protein QR98_0071800 [Sarcoptes scabiei]
MNTDQIIRSSLSSSNGVHRENLSSHSSTPPTMMSKYELQNAVSELFYQLNVCEGKSFNRETTAERFERSIGHQSSKPFSLFYNRLSDNPIFTERYNSLKCRKLTKV